MAGAWTMNVTGGSPSSTGFAGAESPGTTVTLDAGSYSVSETGPSGYAESLGRVLEARRPSARATPAPSPTTTSPRP